MFDRVLSLGPSSLLTLGGVRDFSTITSHPGHVTTHDFVGCMRSVLVDRVDLLRTQPRAMANVTDTCPRKDMLGQCSPHTCQNGGVCLNEWAGYRCQCKDGHSGKHCQTGMWSPYFYHILH